jgi:hypothetical protein
MHVVWMLNLLLSISYSFRKSFAKIFSFRRERLKSPSHVSQGIELGVFPLDFIMLDTKPIPNLEKLIPIILGHLFLAKANACINYQTGVMEISFGHMKVKLNIVTAF